MTSYTGNTPAERAEALELAYGHHIEAAGRAAWRSEDCASGADDDAASAFAQVSLAHAAVASAIAHGLPLWGDES